jgi:hypothetical protein
MKRSDYNRLRHYRPAESCANCCLRDTYTVNDVPYIKCTEMEARNVDDLELSKDFVCSKWRQE